MRNNWKKLVSSLLAAGLLASAVSACGSPAAAPSSSGGSAAPASSSASGSGAPLKISLFYSDNATLPFKSDWLTVQTAQKIANVDAKWEPIPIADYQTKVSLALNTGENAPDVILYQSTAGENASLALNGAIVPISDYSQWTPNFNAAVEKYKLQDDVKALNLSNGKRYYMPALFDQQFYDGGPIVREDLLKKYNLQAPKTYDDLYNVLKTFKQHDPSSYPLTVLVEPRVLYRMTMPAWGISLGKNAASGSGTLSWDYSKKQYFTGAISDQFKAYATYFAKLYKEGLLDPELTQPSGDSWSQKLATGKSDASFAYYDQIGGVEGASNVKGLKLQMYPALAGPAGAHHQPKGRTGSGIMFPKNTASRPDFEQVVRAVDKMFFSEEAATAWCLGAEGKTYTMEGDKIKYANDITSSPDGVYKTMQVKYGCGSDVTQMVWINSREMTKYDDNYAAINKTVAGMGDVIQGLPPTPWFDDMTAEEASSYSTPLLDAFNRWSEEFITGKKSVDKDWDAYVKEMKGLNIDAYCKLYNDHLPK